MPGSEPLQLRADRDIAKDVDELLLGAIVVLTFQTAKVFLTRRPGILPRLQ